MQSLHFANHSKIADTFRFFSKDSYSIERTIGSGASSMVYLAKNSKGTKVAIKSFSNESDCLVESNVLLNLADSRVPKFIEQCQINGNSALVMEYLDGYYPISTLSWQEQSGFIKVGQNKWFELMLEVANALQTIHELNFLHGDISPKNILINRDFKIKLIDFAYSHKFNSPSFRGTPGYMSKESFTLTPKSVSSDICSLGLVFYECLSKRPAFFGSSYEDLLYSNQYNRPYPIERLVPNISLEMQSIINTCIAGGYDSIEKLKRDILSSFSPTTS